MRLSDLSVQEVLRRGRAGSLSLAIGPFDVCLSSSIDKLASSLAFFYQDYALTPDGQIFDFDVSVARAGGLRRWFRPQVQFWSDGRQPFKPLPAAQFFAFFEWGLNWCIAGNAHEFAVVHAAVIERNGQALILPGAPGSGKSTFCAALVSRGWRLLSDEMALFSLATGAVVPVPRPISLKNASIDLIRVYAPGLEIGEPVRDTTKGTVAHVRPPRASVMRSSDPARPAWIVFPKYIAGSSVNLTGLSRGKALLRMIENCFNFPVLGAEGFEVLGDAVEASECYSFEYSSLDDAVAVANSLTSEGGAI